MVAEVGRRRLMWTLVGPLPTAVVRRVTARDAGHEFVDTERFGDVLVGAGVEASTLSPLPARPDRMMMGTPVQPPSPSTTSTP